MYLARVTISRLVPGLLKNDDLLQKLGAGKLHSNILPGSKLSILKLIFSWKTFSLAVESAPLAVGGAPLVVPRIFGIG